jgi:hypothetical protein
VLARVAEIPNSQTFSYPPEFSTNVRSHEAGKNASSTIVRGETLVYRRLHMRLYTSNSCRNHSNIFLICHTLAGSKVMGHRPCFSTWSCAHR